MKVLSFGSLNFDYVYQVPHIVKNGETLSARERNIYSGGKGLNQSVAAARAGLQVWHAGGVSAQDGEKLLSVLQQNGVDTSLVEKRDCPGGHTIIQVDSGGNNSIIAFGGANKQNTEPYVRSVLGHFGSGDCVLLQNEINLNPEIIRMARAKGMRVVLNPSPFDEAIEEVCLSDVDILAVNETEAFGLSGERDAEKQLCRIHALCPNTMVLLTLGGQGSRCMVPSGMEYRQSAYPAEVVDTTAAGDTFIGYFLASWFETGKVQAALKTASLAASIAICRRGAAPSIPFRAEIMDRLRDT